MALKLADELSGFPRHLTQHSGGFVITRDRLDEVAPILNAAMEDRTTIEWDKDDLDALGILKIDVLALGMLTALRKGLDLLDRHYGQRLTVGSVAAGGGLRLSDDPARRHDRRVPDREPRADVDAAAAEAGEILRSRHRGRDRAAGAHPGRHGASLSAPPPGARGRRLSLRGTGGGARQDAGRAAVSGTGDEDRDRRRRLLRRARPTGCAARWRRSGASARSRPFATRWSRAWPRRATTANSPSAASGRSRGLANTVFPRAMRRVSRCWSTPRAG